MKMNSVVKVVGAVTLAAAAASARGGAPLHNFASVHAGMALPDSTEFADGYKMSWCASLDYGTRLGREARWFALGTLGYNNFRGQEGADNTYIGNFDANARWYFGLPGDREAGYIGLGPGVYWVRGGDVFIGGNVGIGGDFPIGNSWSIVADIDQHIINDEGGTMFATFRVGAAYWFR